jgi:uncharacterized protein YjbI with pentapeptide repeats
LADEGLTQAIRSNAVWLGPMTGADLEAAIEQPAIVQGATLQPKLLAQILQDVATEENCLPLLEFALSQLWVGKAESELTLVAYRKLGGVAGALNAHAEAIYKQLASQKREHWVQRVMLRLVRTGEGTKDTRQRQRKSDLLDIGKNVGEKDAIESVIQTLVDGRLLVSDRVESQDVIDLSHEALMVSWQRLAGWRENDREVRRIIDKIEDARREWTDKGKKWRYLLEGRLLKNGKRLLKDAPADVVGTKEFIRKSFWWRRSQFTSVMMIPLLVLGVPAEYFWREEVVKWDYDRIRRLQDRDQEERAAVLNLAGGCWAKKQYKQVSVYFRERIFGNCRSLQDVKLNRANLEFLNLSGADIKSADLSDANIKSADLSGAYLWYANLSGADLKSVNLGNAALWYANLSGADLKSVNLSDANLGYANLRGADLEYANLSGSNLGDVNLSSLNLGSANLSGAYLGSANLSGANLESADLSGSNLGSADLSGANLESANLSSTNLESANLSSSNLRFTDLNSASFGSVSLTSLNLGAVNFQKVKVECSINTNHKKLAIRRCLNLKDIAWNEKTNWQNIQGWELVENIPPALKQQLGLKDKKEEGSSREIAIARNPPL